MYETEYTRPKTLDAAVDLLRGDEDAVCLSGGMTYIPTLKQRLAMPSLLVDLAHVLPRDIEVTADNITIGAGARHVDVQSHTCIRHTLPALADLAGGIGDPMVRNRGTIGGSLANNDPAADYPAAALALAANIITTRGQHPVADFLTGMFETVLEPDEIIKAVRFAVPERAAYVKLASKASGYAVVGVFVAAFSDHVRVGVTGAAPLAFRAREFEDALTQDFSLEALEGLQFDPETMLSDIHADADYRAALALEMTRRAVVKAAIDG